MESETLPVPSDFGFSFSGPEFALILMGAALIRLIPLLVLASGILKLRRFPALRPLHSLLLASVLLIAILGALEMLGLVPTALRAMGIWSFMWIFAMAWLCVTWTRSAIKTRLRPRALDIATLVASGLLAIALAIPLAGNW